MFLMSPYPLAIFHQPLDFRPQPLLMVLPPLAHLIVNTSIQNAKNIRRKKGGQV